MGRSKHPLFQGNMDYSQLLVSHFQELLHRILKDSRRYIYIYIYMIEILI